MNWTARLRGHSFDLDTLIDLFREGDPTIGIDERGYYLRSSILEGVTDAGEVKERADRLLRDVNGIARALDPSFRPVGLTSQFTTDDGRETTVIALDAVQESDRLRAIGVVTDPDGHTPAPPPPPGPKYMALVSSDPNVADAMRFMASELDWIVLYKIYEVIADDLGGEHVLRGSGLADPATLRDFSESANRPQISGDDARHARLGGAPSGRVMSLTDARRLVGDLTRAWMDSKLQP